MAVDSQWPNVSLLLPFSADLLDVKGHTVTAVGGAALSSAHAPAGCTNSLALDGDTDYLTVSGADLALGAGDWAIEVPVYRAGDTVSGSSISSFILDFRTTDPQVAITLGVFGSADAVTANRNKPYVYIDGTTRLIASTSLSTAFTLLTLAKVSGVLRLFFDGSADPATYADANNYTSTSLTIGGRYTPLSGDYRGLNGYVGPLRITVGNGRGYSTTFTPPSFPFPRPTISGVTYSSAAVPAQKLVVALKRSTMVAAGHAVSDASTGAYTIYPSDFTEHVALEFDATSYPLVDGGSGENAIIYDRVIPGG